MNHKTQKWILKLNLPLHKVKEMVKYEVRDGEEIYIFKAVPRREKYFEIVGTKEAIAVWNTCNRTNPKVEYRRLYAVKNFDDPLSERNCIASCLNPEDKLKIEDIDELRILTNEIMEEDHDKRLERAAKDCSEGAELSEN